MPAITKSNIQPSYYGRFYLSFVEENVIFSRDVNMPTITYPLLEIDFDGTGTGSTSDVLEDMDIRITRSGVEVGRLRVAPGAITGSTLQVNEFSQGRLDLQDNDRLEVLRSWRVRDRLVAANEDFDVDSRVAYTDQHEDPAPVANAEGGAYVGWLSQSSFVNFSAATSFTVDIDSSGTLSYLWEFPAGTVPITLLTVANPTVDFTALTAGTYYASVTVTDTSNSKSTIKRIPIILHDDSYLPLDISEARLSSSVEGGYTLEVEMPYSVTIDTMPDGAEVFLWADEYYGGVQNSYGDTYRPEQKFRGYLVRDSIQRDAEAQTITFTAICVRQLLEELPGFSAIYTSVNDPSTWREYRGVSVGAIIVMLLRERSTALVTCDVNNQGFNYPYFEIPIQQNVPYAQVQELSDAIDCIFTSDRRGRMRIARPVVLTSTATRNAATNVITLDEDDIIDINIDREHRYPINTLEGRGFLIGGNLAIFSRAPGDAPSEGAAEVAVDYLIAQTQTELNQRTGWRYAQQNGLYNGLPITQNIDLNLRGGYDVFDTGYPDEWVTIDGVTTYRVDYESERCTLTGMSVTYTPEFVEVNLTLAGETDGVAGVTYIPPIPNEVGMPDFDPITIIPFPPPTQTVNRIGAWDGINRLPIRIGALSANTDGFAVITLNSDFTSSAAAYTTGLSGDGIDWAQDPYQFARQFVLTSTGLYKVDDIDAFTSWSLVADNATMFGDAARIGVRVIMSNNRRGWIAVGSGYSVAVTFNYGSTWTQVDISGLNVWNTTTPNFDPGNVNLEISNWNSGSEGHVYASWFQGLNSARIAKSLDYGLTWSLLINRTGGTAGGANRAHIKVPYQIGGVENRNGSAQKIYAAITNVNTFQVYTQATSTESVAISNPSSFPGGALHAFTWDGNRIALANQATTQTKVIATRTAPGAFTATSMIFSGFGVGGNPQVGISGFSFHSDFLCAYWRGSGGYGVGSLSGGNPIVISPDFGATWYNITPTSIWSSPYRTAAAGALLTDFQ